MYVSFRELGMLINGKEREMHLQWEIARWQQFIQISISPDIKPGSKPKKPTDLLLFPWEEENEKVQKRHISREEMAGLNNIWEIFYKKKNNS